MLQIMNKLRPGATSSVAPCSRSAFGGRSKLTNWRSQSFTDAANEANASPEVIRNAKRTRALQRRQTRQVPPVFTLKHLSHLTGVSYGFLRDCVERYGDEPYKVFRILKRQLPGETKPRYRMISVPDDRLMARKDGSTRRFCKTSTCIRRARRSNLDLILLRPHRVIAGAGGSLKWT